MKTLPENMVVQSGSSGDTWYLGGKNTPLHDCIARHTPAHAYQTHAGLLIERVKLLKRELRDMKRIMEDEK